ncbi:FAD-binding protein [Streptacidiphilus sp. ASG 303]|uniref:FAD-binding oxidoreductase n=1 Tax=Streptacidiphilus sp. ASG 303 TaxID=2896847 RepID=UPI001E4E9C7C|nr:FAD-binding oxidoreductase [Streptacidiphilus sp. ASG 303]MCD0484216.1 FAD-binding protein [Streptacidiphilus sp. ASG 303]
MAEPQTPEPQTPESRTPAPGPAGPDGAGAPSTTGRRTLLRAGTGAAAALWLAACSPAAGRAPAAAPAGGGLPAAPAGDGLPATGSVAPSARPATRYAAASPTAAGPGDWAALSRDLDGYLVRPGDRRYPVARESFQPRYDTAHPAAVAYPANPQDVATCLAFARRHRLPVAVRGGGHSYAGWSTTTGLLVDTGRMASVSASRGAASVGAGARLVDVYAGLAAHGVTVPAGSCPTVGVAGLALGGGVGVTGRAYGLTSDNLTAAQIVTADGRIRTVDARHDPDLFWALRGGGGGNFGVVTRLDFRTHPAPACSYAFLYWPWRQAAAVLRGWQRWAPAAPDPYWSSLHLSANHTGPQRVGVTVVHLGSASGLQAQLSRLEAAVGAAPATAVVRSRPYLDTMLAMAGTLGWSIAQNHLPGDLPGRRPQGRVVRESYGARSDFYNRGLSDAAVRALLAGVERYSRTVPAGGSCAVALDALGGAINRVRPQDTAFVHRDGLFLAQYIANWPEGASVPRNQAWLDGVWRSMRPYASGRAYQNYVDPQLTDWQQAYYGGNLARLRRVKAAYDPGRLFTFPQAVPNG